MANENREDPNRAAANKPGRESEALRKGGSAAGSSSSPLWVALQPSLRPGVSAGARRTRRRLDGRPYASARPLMPRRVRLVQGRAGQPTSRRGRLPLVVLELVGALAAHAVVVISGAGVLHPRMMTLGTVAQTPQPSRLLSTLSTPLQEAAHPTEHARFGIRSCRDALVPNSGYAIAAHIG
jgi:hypothetical protein